MDRCRVCGFLLTHILDIFLAKHGYPICRDCTEWAWYFNIPALDLAQGIE